MTKAELIIKALKERGCIEAQTYSSQYRKFTRPDDNRFYFISNNGSLRTGYCLVGSLSCRNQIPELLERLK